MENQAPKVSPSRHLALRFISGKYQGGEFPLGDSQEIVVGRSSDLDMVLVEDMVSRRHARIACSDQQIVIEDLGSTNGTFVNGEKIKRATLKEGDRVLIGTSILKVVSTDAAGGTAVARRPVEPAQGNRSGQAKSMSGSIDEIPLPDLLQLFGSSKKSGVLVVRSDQNVGRIYLRKGIVYFATINDLEDVQPYKSIFRILTWVRGHFDLEAPDDRTLPGEINASVQELLMEGLRQLDEFNAIRHKLPKPETHLSIPRPLKPSLHDLAAKELDVLQVAYNTGYFEAILNQSPSTDLDTANVVMKLMASGYLVAE